MAAKAERRMFGSPPHLALVLEGTTAGRTARRALERILVADAAAVGLRRDVALVVAELVTNAVQAAGRCSLSAWHLLEHGVVRVEVDDTAAGMPTVQPLDVRRIGGHGLRIVDSVSTRWGVIPLDDHKIVWAELRHGSGPATTDP